MDSSIHHMVHACQHTYEDTYNTPCLFSFSYMPRYYCLSWQRRERYVKWFQLCLWKENREKKCFLELPSERNFNFMVLIIFLRNHSRIKHKDAESVPLSDAPQWGSLVKKKTRSFPPALFSNFSFYNPTLYNLLKERQKEPGSSLMHLLRLRDQQTHAWQKQSSFDQSNSLFCGRQKAPSISNYSQYGFPLESERNLKRRRSSQIAQM